MSSSESQSHNVFVYGSILEPAVAAVILDRTADNVPAVLHGYHRYKLKGLPYPCIVPLESGKVNGKDNSEKMKVEIYVWINKDDLRMYGEWDFDEWRVVHGEKFKKILEWNKNPNGNRLEDVAGPEFSYEN